MISKLKVNRVRRTYLGGGRIDAFTGHVPVDDGVPVAKGDRLVVCGEPEIETDGDLTVAVCFKQ